MFPLAELVRLVLQTLPQYVLRPELALVVGLVLVLVHRQYARLAVVEERLLGRPKQSAAQRTLVGLLYGLGGGVVGTAAFLVLGLSLNDVGIWYLWPVALALFLLHPRFICFAYAGGLVSLVHLLTGWPDIHVPSLMALVAVLHLVESVLIWLHGASDPTPVYVRRRGGDVVGGFTLQKFWPLPFVAMLGVLLPGEFPSGELLAMPDWWPLLRGDRSVPEGEQFVYLLFPVVAALGYGDIALTRSPVQKARRTALTLMGYSLALMALALLAEKVHGWAWLAALFSPLAHEAVIAWGRWGEDSGPPYFSSREHPVVLDVVPGSTAQRLGLRPGDVVVEVNGHRVRTKADVRAALGDALGYTPGPEESSIGGVVPPSSSPFPSPSASIPSFSSSMGTTGDHPLKGSLVVKRSDQVLRLFGVPWGEGPLGILLAPEPFDLPVVDLTDRSRYARVIAGLRRLWRRVSARA